MAEHAEQIEAEVRGVEAPSIEVPAMEWWGIWYAHPQSDQWQYHMATRFGPRAEREEATLRAQRCAVQIVHYTLPALTIAAKETPDGKGD